MEPPDTSDTTDTAWPLDAAIHKFYELIDNPDNARRLFHWLSGFVKNVSKTNVERASKETHLSEKIIKEIFHNLEKAGIGYYNKGGQGGHKPRFYWDFPLTEVIARLLSQRGA